MSRLQSRSQALRAADILQCAVGTESIYSVSKTAGEQHIQAWDSPIYEAQTVMVKFNHDYGHAMLVDRIRC